MKRLIPILIFSLCLCFNCSTDEINAPFQTSNIDGEWELTNVTGGLQGVDINYSPGEVKWDFDTSTSTLTVTNLIISTCPEDIYSGHDTGVYNFNIVSANGIDTLYIDSVERGVITISNNMLQIDDGLATDGFLTTFQ